LWLWRCDHDLDMTLCIVVQHHWRSGGTNCLHLQVRRVCSHLLYKVCRICDKCVCSISTGSWMSYVQWRNWYTIFFVHLGIILILVLEF
jgi:hypothetical protein